MKTQSTQLGITAIPSNRQRRTSRATRYIAPMAMLTGWLASGCMQGEAQGLGYTNDALSTATESAEPVTPRDFVGHWVGQAEDLLALTSPAPIYQFPSGSTQISLFIGDQEASVVFGEGPPLPSPTDLSEAHPAGLPFESYEIVPVPDEGLSYPLYSSRFASEIPAEEIFPGQGTADGPDVSLAEADGIRRFQYQTNQVYAEWCALHPTLPDGRGGYNCLGALGVSMATDGLCYTFDSNDDFFPRGGLDFGIIPEPARQVDCARAYQCFDQCSCPSGDPAETRCMLGPSPMGELWLRKDAGGLFGTFAGAAVFENEAGARTALGRARFTRVEP